MSEIKEYFEKISTSPDYTPHLSAWKKPCKKEFQNSKIYGIVTVIWLVVMTILKIMIPNSWIVDFILNCFYRSFDRHYLYACLKKIILKNERY